MRLDLLALVAGTAFIVVAAVIARDTGSATRPRRWWLPAGLSVVFAAFSVITVLRQGPLGFRAVHTRNLWGNQIWFDLLSATGVARVLLAPRARCVSMPPLPWWAAVACTGSSGLCAMLARALYLEEHGRPPWWGARGRQTMGPSGRRGATHRRFHLGRGWLMTATRVRHHPSRS